MPCATIHLHLADRVFESWQRSPGLAPFTPDRPGIREAFLHGALAPDMGFVPGVDRFLSELSHYHSSGDLCRTLLGSAGSEEQTAFAWGWITHVMGDVALHPLVGRACGERLLGDRDRRLNAAEDLPTHVGMEVGLDIVFLEREPTISLPPTTPVLTPKGVGHVTGALKRTYGIAWTPERVLADHRRAVHLTAWWPHALRRIARGSRLTRAAVGSLRSFAGPRSALAGFLRPIRPPQWIIDEVTEYARDFPERVQEQLESGLASIRNMNLETGTDERDSEDHPGQAEARQRLHERRLLGAAY
jgi:hypothetical protein